MLFQGGVTAADSAGQVIYGTYQVTQGNKSDGYKNILVGSADAIIPGAIWGFKNVKFAKNTEINNATSIVLAEAKNTFPRIDPVESKRILNDPIRNSVLKGKAEEAILAEMKQIPSITQASRSAIIVGRMTL